MSLEKKRSPGRPCTVPKIKRIPKHGIQEEPANKENCVEFVYDSPYLFRRTMSLFKNMNAKEIVFDFRADCVRLLACDHTKQSRILMTINCEQAVRYYCMSPIIAIIDAKKFEKIMTIINKSYNILSISKKITEERSRITFSMIDMNEMEEVYDVDLITSVTVDNNDDDFYTDDHKIHFTLTDKMFKSFICNSKTLANVLTIRKYGQSHPLTFSHKSEDKMISGSRTINNGEKINLDCSGTDENEIFTMSVNIGFLKPITTSVPQTTQINIHIHDTKKMVSSYPVDDGFIVVYVATTVLGHD